MGVHAGRLRQLGIRATLSFARLPPSLPVSATRRKLLPGILSEPRFRKTSAVFSANRASWASRCPKSTAAAAAPLIDALVVIEELGKECRPAGFQVFEANTGPAKVVSLLGTDEQRQRFLPSIVSGDATMAVAISEPDAGSAATDMTTRAKLADGTYTVNGTKRWISNGGEADYYLVYARMSDEPGARGIGAVIVEADREGVSFGAPERLMGFRGIPSADVIFDNVRVPEENLLIGAGGFRRLFTAFSIERMGNATMSLAIGQAALDRTIAYVQERVQFGKPLIEFQTVQMTLADMVLQVEAARQLVYQAGRSAGSGPTQLAASVAGENHRQRDGEARDRHGDAAAWRQWLHRGVRTRAPAP